MKRLLTFLTIAVVGLCSFSGPALAVDSTTVKVVPILGTQGSGVPTFVWDTSVLGATGFHSGKQVYAIIDAYKFMKPIAGGSGAVVTTFVLSTNKSATGDSINYSLEVGPTSSGPWSSIYAMGNINLGTKTATTATAYNLKAAIATSTLPPMPYWRIVAKAKKSFTTAAKFYLSFANPN